MPHCRLICKPPFFRLDFETLVLTQPADNTGVCTVATADTLIVNGPTGTPPPPQNLCGTLTGQHSMWPWSKSCDRFQCLTLTCIFFPCSCWFRVNVEFSSFSRRGEFQIFKHLSICRNSERQGMKWKRGIILHAKLKHNLQRKLVKEKFSLVSRWC